MTTQTDPRSTLSMGELPLLDSLGVDVARNRLHRQLLGHSEALRVGRFVLERELGSGAMGTVWQAFDEQLGRVVALKFLRNERAGEQGEARLYREAQGLAKLAHPNVVPVYDVGRHCGRVWIAMEFVAGRTLREWVEREQPRRSEVLSAWLAIGRGLAAVHAAGLIHRDVKPANAMLGDDGRPRLVDFGLVRSREAELTEPGLGGVSGTLDSASTYTITQPGGLIGTPAYMAPEQLRGQHATESSDQFSFCVSLVEALAGERPHASASLGALLTAIEDHDPKLPRRLNRRTRRALRRGLAAKVEDRWPTMDSLLDELERAQSSRRPKLVALGALALTAAAGTAGYELSGVTPEPAHCSVDSSALDGYWDAGKSAELEAAFAATGLSYAEANVALAREGLERWRGEWFERQQAACEDTLVHGTQSSAMLDRQTACLERARAGFSGVVDVLIRDAEHSAAYVPELLDTLPSLASCSVVALTNAGEVSASDASAGLAEVARGRALMAAGDYVGAREAAAQASLAAERSGDQRTALGARALVAHADIAEGQLDAGYASLRDAADIAARAGLIDDELSLRVELALRVQGQWSKPELERWALADAERLADQIASPHDPRWAQILRARGLRARFRADYDEASRELERALELVDPLGAAALDIQMDLAGIARKRGELDEARTLYETLARVYGPRLGPRHPRLGHVAYNRGVLEIDAGRYRQAATQLDLAQGIYAGTWGPETLVGLRTEFARIRIDLSTGELEAAATKLDELLPRFEAVVGAEHSETAQAFNARGILAFYAGDYPASLAAYERALAGFRAAFGDDHDEVGLIHANIGESLAALGRFEQALESFERGIGILERRLGPDHAYLGPALKGRGIARFELGAMSLALADLQRAQVLLRASNEELELADATFALARVLRERGDDTLASEHGLEAARLYTKLGQQARADEIQAWLESSPR